MHCFCSIPSARFSRVLLPAVLLLAFAPAWCAAYEEFCDRDDFADKRFIDERMLGEIRKLDQKYDKPVTPEAAAQLGGANSFSISVIDDQTMRPVTEYLVHAVVVGRKFTRWPKKQIHPEAGQRLDDDWETNPKKFREEEKLLGLGRLESRRVKDAGGFCRYEGLGRLEVEFQVWAKGYGPKSLMARIPQAGASAIIRLKAAGAVKGRVVDSAGAPLARVAVTLYYPDKNAPGHYAENYAAMTGADGIFTLDTLPPDTYTIGFPGLASSLHDLNEKGDQAWRREREKARTITLDPATEARVSAAGRASASLIISKLTPIDLTRAGECDLGTIRLEKSPILDLAIVDAQGSPMAAFPFEIRYLDETGANYQFNYKARVGLDGKTSLTLAGWQPGMRVIVYAPDAQEQLYKVSAIEPPRPTPTPFPQDEAQIYEQRKDLWETVLEVDDPGPGKDVDEEELMEKAKPVRLRYDQLDEHQKANLRLKIESEKRQLQETLARTEHPNTLIFTPRPGELSAQRLVFKPADGMPTLHIRCVDRITGQPVAVFRGCFQQSASPISQALMLAKNFEEALVKNARDGERYFQSDGKTGRATITTIQLSRDFLEREKLLAKLPPQSDGRSALERDTAMSISIHAPGYVIQSFELTIAQLRAGKELTFELEPEAVVRGRVRLAETGKPLTTSSLDALLRRHGKTSGAVNQFGFRERTLGIRFMNTAVESGTKSQGYTAHVPEFAGASLDAQGCFEIRSMRPSDFWQCTLEAEGLPPYNRSGIALKPGINELEDILVGAPGGLIVKVADAQGRPLPNTWLDLPLEASDFKTTATDAAGEVRIDMRPLNVDKQVVNLCPPWGHGDKLDEYSDKQIVFAAEKDLPRTAINTLTPRLVQGHTLLIEIPRTPLRDDLARFYAAEMKAYQESVPYYNPRQRRPDSFIGVCWAALQALEPGPDGFTYHQKKGFMAGIRFTSDTMSLRLENVPPGRHALRLDWGQYTARPADAYSNSGGRPGSDAPIREKDVVYICDDNISTFAYTELLMPDTTATLKLELNAADVEISLKDPPATVPNAKNVWNKGYLETVVFLEREEPLSFIHSGASRMVLAHALASATRTPESLTMPMVSYFRSFELKDAGAGKTVCPPVLFRSLAPGSYRVQVYADVQGTPGWQPYYETTIKVGRNTGKLQLAVPYEAPKKYEPPRPAPR